MVTIVYECVYAEQTTVLFTYLFIQTLSLRILIWSGLGDFFKGAFEQRFLHLFTAITFFT